jgi:hypothetical protein
MEQDVPVARRRRVFLQALEQKMTPGGREVAGPRTPWSLHPTLAAASSSFNITGFKIGNPDPPPRRNWEEGGAPNRSPDPRERKGTPPSSAAGLHRAPPPKEARTCTKSTAGDPTSSMAPPAEEHTSPTLSTTEKRGSPALPSPERATEDEGSGGTPVRRWICGRAKKSQTSRLVCL